MIYDKLEKASVYVSAHERLDAAVEFLRQDGLLQRADGRYDLSEGLYASLQTYDSKPAEESLFESHRRYIDVQCVLEGEEWIYVADFESLVITREYKPDEDCSFFRGSADVSRVLMRPGLFLLLFPSDAHMPSIAVERRARVRKAVVKLPVREGPP